MGVKYAMRVIRETHHAWKKLISETCSQSSHPMVRQLSVPNMERLDVASDHVACSVLLGPDGTPRLPPQSIDVTGINFEFLPASSSNLSASAVTAAPATVAVGDSGALEF